MNIQKEVTFDPSTQYLHGPGGLFSQPGLGDDDDDETDQQKGDSYEGGSMGAKTQADDKKEPKGVQEYGDVKFADPKNKKYPIDTEEHVRAAWSYINQADNASQYSAEELAKVKANIVAAAKKFGIQIADQKKNLSVVKQANGLYRWNSISSNNIIDRDDETVSLKMLQADVARTKMFGDDSELYFYHIPYPIGGAPDYRAIIDGFLVESGEFYGEPVAKAVAEFIDEHPDGLDGTGWGVSIGFQSVPDLTGTYYNGFIKERSPLPMSAAANQVTQFGVKNKMAITPEQQKALDTVLGDPTLVGVVQTALSAKEQSKMADEKGVVRKAKAQPAPEQVTAAAQAAAATQAAAAQPPVPVLKAGKNEATPMEALGFGKVETHQKDAAAVQAAVQAEGAAALVADDADDRLMAAMAATDAAVSATIAEGRAAAALGTTPEAPIDSAKTTDPAPIPATNPSADSAQTQTPPVPAQKAGLSDEDMAGIAKFVNETVSKAVADCMGQMKAELTSMYGEMSTMKKTIGVQTQVKMMNEVPLTVYERLKAFGMAGGQGIPPTVIDEEGKSVRNPAFVEKGKNLPEASEDKTMMSLLGFES